MAHEPFFGAVVGEGEGAVLAFADLAAGRALEGAGEATAIEKEDGLLSLLEALVHGLA